MPYILNRLLKYFIQGSIIYLLFKYVPKHPMNNEDIIVQTLIILLTFSILENIYEILCSKNYLTQDQCNVCASNESEHMKPISITQTYIPTTLQPTLPPPSTFTPPPSLDQSVLIKPNDEMQPMTSPIIPIESKPTPIKQYTDYNTLPTGNTKGKFEYGYSFLPPSQWYPQGMIHAPICLAEKECPVCPVYTQGTNIDLKEWNENLVS